MSVYSIKDLEHLSGIKAHTIRIWEQRYNIFSPQRTSTNIRFYDQDDLKLVLNISTLRNHGYKISKLVEMSGRELIEEVEKITSTSHDFEDQIHSLTLSMIELDEKGFTQAVDQNLDRFGFEKTMVEIIYPFMRKIGILWLTNAINPAQEHFISHLVRQKLITATDKLSLNQNGSLFLLFLPEGELHELGILFANYLIRARGFRTIFFGQSVPLNAIEEVYHKLEPEFLLTSLTTAPNPSEVQSFVDSLSRKFKDSTVFLTGSQVVGHDITQNENVTVINQFQDLERILSEVKTLQRI